MKTITSIVLSTMFLLRPSSARGLSTFVVCNSSSRRYDVVATPRIHVHKYNGISNGGLMVMSSSSSLSETHQKKSPKKKRIAKKKVALQRIDKVLADRGVGTRSQTFEVAKAKRITMDPYPGLGAPYDERTRIKGPKEKVPYDAILFLDGNVLPSAAPLLLAYHKPKFVLSVMEDDEKYKDQERKHLGQVLNARYKRCGMHPVGRLDYDTTGLILFSLDGKLTQRLLHPRRGVEKEYVATVQGAVDEEKLRQMLSDGVETSDGTFTAQLLEVTPSDGPASSNPAEDELTWDEESSTEDRAQFDYSGEHSDVRLIVTEGKYRMVRRILANSGYPVVELRRERHGEITLQDLAVGEFRDATDDELTWAESLLK